MAAGPTVGNAPAAIEWPEWHGDLEGNKVGEAHAFTAFAPMTWWKALGLAVLLSWVKCRPTVTLRRHRFVYFGRWTLARVPGSKLLADRYVLIETNFNGSFAEYIDTLSIDLAPNLTRIWGRCHGCPKLMQPPAAFRNWARKHELKALHYFCAYPEATVKQIETALIAERTSSPREAKEEIRTMPRLTLMDRLRGIGAIIRPDRALPAGAHPGQVRKTTVSAVTCLTPILEERRDELEAHLRGIDEDARLGRGSPLDRVGDDVPSTHFARWAIVDKWVNLSRSDAPPTVPHLLFGAIGDGTPREYLKNVSESICEPGRQIWTEYCEGGGTGPLDEYLYRHRLRRGLLFAGYRASVREVRQALIRFSRHD